MQVHKFGGASLHNSDRFLDAAHIIAQQCTGPTVLVVSAMGKTTNALEKVVAAFMDNRQPAALQLFEQIKNQHLTVAKYLLVLQYHACVAQLNDFFTEASWLLHDKPVRNEAYYYDQLVAVGELMSSTLLSFLLKEKKIANEWMDVRDIIRTNDNFKEANIDWPTTEAHVKSLLRPALQRSSLIVTQGFIGCTADNESTTLGREGSDFSGAILANLLDAQSLTIWKDVPAIMNADPKKFEDTQPIPTLSYEEVIEMAYYGAQVIHPKTIKPIFQKKIPLLVKCFLDSNLPGTLITHKKSLNLPPIIVKKEQQAMVEFKSRDFSFIGEHSVGLLFQLFEQEKTKPNLTQNGAIQFIAVFDEQEEKLQHIATQASEWLQVMVRKNLTLITVRHATNEWVSKLMQGKKPLLMQQAGDTVQFLLA